MFNQLFPYPRVAERHQNGPLADARLCYLDHLAAQGAAPLTLRNTARELLVIAREMCWDGSGKVNLEQIAAAANHWATRPQHPCATRSPHSECGGSQSIFYAYRSTVDPFSWLLIRIGRTSKSWLCALGGLCDVLA